MNLFRRLSALAVMAAAVFAISSPMPGRAASAATLSDPLTGGKTVAVRRNGGELRPEGYKVTSNGARGVGQYLYYLLPAGATGGVATFEAMGFRFDKYPNNGGETEEREHILGLFDADELHDPGNKPIGFFLRFYDHKNVGGTFFPGSHRFRFDSPTFEHQCQQKAAVKWDATRWYQFKVEWSPTFVRWYKDGVQQCSVSLPNIRTPLRHFYLGSDNRKAYMNPVDITYRNLTITTK